MTEDTQTVAAGQLRTAAKPLTDFERGYLIACANVANLHSEPVIGADVAMELGVSWSQIASAGFCEYDLSALKDIRAQRPDVFASRPATSFTTAAQRADT